MFDMVELKDKTTANRSNVSGYNKTKFILKRLRLKHNIHLQMFYSSLYRLSSQNIRLAIMSLPK